MKYLIVVFSVLAIFSFDQKSEISKDDMRIQPYKKNPRYWQYKGKPVLLLGASNDDNLFQWPKEMLIPHLDSLKAAGGNYVRNTMSDRVDKGFELYPFKKLENSKYDLNQWNEEYWGRFEVFLSETAKRDIIVQIEIWDRFDYSRDNWPPNPYNPANNVNYTYEASGFATDYPEHPGRNQQPFFFTTPLQRNNQVVFPFQQAFVEKLLSVSLNYDHVLYCMDNETSAEEEWAIYWAELVKKEAGSKIVNVTEMWNDKKDFLGEHHRRTIDHPERYDFIDISQNTWIEGQQNWQNAQKVMDYIKDQPRPVNSTKIYGNDISSHNSYRTTQHATQTFFRNIVGGFASSRFHRPTGGIGLSPVSVNCIKSIRLAETKVKFWDLAPRMDLLSDCEENEAYLTASEGESYLLYFTGEGAVRLDVRQQEGTFSVRVMDVQNPEWKEEYTIEGGDRVEIASDCQGGALIGITKN